MTANITNCTANNYMVSRSESLCLPAKDLKTIEVAQRSLLPATLKGASAGLFESRLIRALTAIATFGLQIAFIALYPLSLAVLAISVAVAVLGLAVAACTLDRVRMGFEAAAFGRLLKLKNYDEISQVNGHKLLLGALPNMLKDSKMIRNQIGPNGTVVSINESWEREPLGLSVPMTKEGYEALGIRYYPIDSKDHAIVGSQKLDMAADKIHEGLQKGNVYVHCRAGVGRSATAVAAYLMKYQNKSIEESCSIIKEKRPGAVIWNKVHGLVDYHSMLKNPAPISSQVKEKAEKLRDMESHGKKPKLSKKDIELLSKPSGYEDLTQRR